MSEQEKILEALANLSASMTKGFEDMGARFEEIENRLGNQERKTRKTAQRQVLQEKEIQELKDIVYKMAETQPYMERPGGVAIRKEPAYRAFAKRGIGKVTAMRALRDAGTIMTDCEGHNTCVIYLDGQCERVIVVKM